MKQEFRVTGMTCAACQAAVNRAVKKISAVSQVEVNLLTGLMRVEYDEKLTSSADIMQAVEKVGYGIQPKSNKDANQSGTRSAKSEWEQEKKEKNQELKTMKIRLIFSILLLVPLLWVSMGGMIGLPQPSFLSGESRVLVNALYQLVLTSAIMLINKKFFVSGAKALAHRSPNMDSLVMLGSGAAYIYSLAVTFLAAASLGAGDLSSAHTYIHSLYYESSATILTLVTLGKFFESVSKQRTTKALDQLMDLTPKTVSVLRQGTEQTIDFADLRQGDIVVVRTGDIIPADGIIVEGEGVLDTSAVTGESMPVEKASGDQVISASVCKDGCFQFRADRVGENSTLEQIIQLVEQSGSSKAPISRLADRVSAVFVPVVIAVALITFVAWMIATSSLSQALKSAISVLVISCPCALGLATPVAIMVAMGKSAGSGVLFKSAEGLETLAKAKTILFDKTGTITKGSPVVTDILTAEGTQEGEVLADLAALESASTHPLAKAILAKAAEFDPSTQGGAKVSLTQFSTTAGGGVSALSGGERWLAGSVKYVETETSLNISAGEWGGKINQLKQQGKTIVVFAQGGNLSAVVGIADEVKPSSAAAIQELNRMGVETVLLSGDNQTVADYVGELVGVKKVYAEVLPQDKSQIVSSFKEKGGVVMVGDGINDSPALACADVGISVSTGTDIARETADVILTNNSMEGVVTAVRLSRTTLRTIKVNLFWAFFYNALGIPLAAGVFYAFLGWQLSPMVAALAMSFSSVCVVLNSLTINLFHPFKTSSSLTDNSQKNKKNSPPPESTTDPSSPNNLTHKIKEEAKNKTDNEENNNSENNNIKNENKEDQDIENKQIVNQNMENKDAKNQDIINQDAENKNTENKKENNMKKVIKIEGMMCAHCTARVSTALQSINGVSKVTVSLEEKSATIDSQQDISDATLKAKIEEQGYQVTSITTM